MKRESLLISIAVVGTAYSIYLFATQKELLFLFFTLYYPLLIVLLSFYIYTKKQVLLSGSLLLSLTGTVFFFTNPSFLTLLAVAFLAFGVYTLLGTSPGRVVRYPSSVLRQKAEEFTSFEDTELLDEMKEIVGEEDGAGLAAPQIGVSKRVVVVRTEKETMVFVNPKITPVGSEKIVSREGCLSLKGIWVDVQRYSKIMVEAQNRKGESVVLEAEGMLSIILQHETDHLEGVLIIDHLPLKERIKELFKYFLREYLW